MVKSLSYYTGLESIDQGSKKAKFYLLNTSPNRDNWSVSEKALDEGLPTLIGKPIGLGVNYEPGHDDTVGEMRDVGTFTSFENKGNYALGTAEISDPKALEMLKANKLGPVSVVIQPYRKACSGCKHTWTNGYEQHTCPNAYEIIESFVFQRVDFVKVPSYPQANLLELASSFLQSNSSVPLPVLAAAYEGSQTNLKNKKIENFGEQPMSERENTLYLEKINSGLTELSANLKATSAKLDLLTGKVDALEAENKLYKAAKRNELVEKALTVRKAACLGDATVDRVTFSNPAFPDDALNTVITDAQKILDAKKAGKQDSTGTDQTYDNQETHEGLDQLAAAVNERRAKRGLAPLKAEETQ